MKPLKIPPHTEKVLHRLRQRGYEGYLVGGCVRDALMGKVPHDWDICTSALPEETLAAFSDHQTITNGMKHGTVTVISHGEPVEITTYRKEGSYADHRRPDCVTFVSDLTEDLARRDFTINGMAYSPQSGVIDQYSGQADLAAGVIRCVGVPNRRFQEDALRILRGLRFAATLDFKLDAETRAAMVAHKEELNYVSAERVKVELDKLLVGPGAVRVLRENVEIMGVVLPELLPCVGFDQKNPHHVWDIWEHTLHALAFCPPDLTLRWAVLLHDVGKPQVFSIDEKGVGHFIGHAGVSVRLTHQIFRRLKSDRATEQAVAELVEHHDHILAPDRKRVLRWLNRLGEERLRQLLVVQRCDKLAHRPEWGDQVLAGNQAFEQLMDKLLRQGACYRLDMLAVTGGDLLKLGIPAGKAVGETLNALLKEVMGGGLPNERERLLARARQINRNSRKTVDKPK